MVQMVSDGIVVVMLSPTRDSPEETRNLISGADVRAFRFIEHCSRIGISTHVVTNSYGAKLLDGKVVTDIRIFRLPGPLERNRRFDLLKSYVILPLMSLGYIMSFRSQPIVGVTALPPDAVPISIAGLLHRSSWVYFHHWVRVERFADLLPKILQFATVFILKLSSVEVFVLPASLSRMRKIVGEKRVRTFQNGVEPPNPATVGARPGVDVLYVGRVNPRKGSDDLIKIWERVVKLDGTRRLTVVGAIEDPRFLTKMRDSFASKTVVVRGQVTEDEKLSLLGSARCFVSTSHEEGWGLSISEAIGAGLPVVAYDLPAYDYASSNLLRVPLGDLDGFAKAIVSAPRGDKKSLKLKSWNEVIESDLARILPEKVRSGSLVLDSISTSS